MRLGLFAGAILVVCLGGMTAYGAEEKYDSNKFSSYAEYLRSKTPLGKRLGELVISECSFKDTELKTVIEYIRDQTKEVDPDGRGFNLFYRCSKDAQKQTISLDLENVPVTSLLRFVCLAASDPINFKIEDHAVVIMARKPKEKVNLY